MRDKTHWLELSMGIVIGIAIAIVLFAILEADAHTPCDQQEPVCHYVQVVNPLSGKLEQQYICE
ncbi:hypothetical protein LCGC14_2587230 [marine sediment metagenome]|uniref:Uncharacterized protein n=1 Tax=marine sediment metagenome TaxID=412755 RepID=A0A0F9ACN1_9ZZZZ